MDSTCLTREVGIERTNNDSTMLRSLSVRANKVLPIQGENCTSFQSRKGKHIFVRKCLIMLPGFGRREDIMTKLT